MVEGWGGWGSAVLDKKGYAVNFQSLLALRGDGTVASHAPTPCVLDVRSELTPCFPLA